MYLTVSLIMAEYLYIKHIRKPKKLFLIHKDLAFTDWCKKMRGGGNKQSFLRPRVDIFHLTCSEQKYCSKISLSMRTSSILFIWKVRTYLL